MQLTRESLVDPAHDELAKEIAEKLNGMSYGQATSILKTVELIIKNTASVGVLPSFLD